MPNPLYNEMKKNSQNCDMETMFSNFMEQFRGQNPNAIIEQMVQSGKLSQSQLNMVQGRAKQITGSLEHLREKFNF